LSPSCRVIALTSFSEDEKVFAAIKAGATGYMLKDILAEELSNAIRSVASGGFLLHPEIASKVLEEFSGRQAGGLAPARLTARENDVLKLLARHRTNREIAQELSISIKTVKTHVSNILSKLHMMDRTEASLFAVRRGLVAPDTPDLKTRS
jgi:NarL family two-component system response regulator LiaR